jgi:hypothetical protein
MSDTNTRVHSYLLNGIVRINGADLATISELNGPVDLIHHTEITEHTGSRPHPVEANSVSGRITVKLSATNFMFKQLVALLGYTETVGTLDDGITPAAIFSVTNQNATFGVRPVIQLLIKGTKSITAKKVEIEAARAILISDFSFNLDKEKMAVQDMTFLILGDTSDRAANVVTIADEDTGS